MKSRVEACRSNQVKQARATDMEAEHSYSPAQSPAALGSGGSSKHERIGGNVSQWEQKQKADG